MKIVINKVKLKSLKMIASNGIKFINKDKRSNKF